MGSFSKTTQSIIQGISQQPDAFMIEGQCRDQKNAIPSPIEGIIKRPSTEYQLKLDFLDGNREYKFFAVELNSREYLVIMSTSFLYLVEDNILINTFDLIGNVAEYLGDNLNVLKLYLINDQIYILNTEQEVRKQDATAISHAISCTIWAVGISQDKRYAATVNVHLLSDDSIAYTTSTSFLVDTAAETKSTLVISTLNGGLDASTFFTKGVKDNVLICRLLPSLYETHYITVTTSDDASNTFLKSYSDTIRTIDELPEYGFEAQRAVVSAAEGNIEDVYFTFVPETIVTPFAGETINLGFALNNLDYNKFVDTDTEQTFTLIAHGAKSKLTTLTSVRVTLYDLFKANGDPLLIGDTVDIGYVFGSKITAKRIDASSIPLKGYWKETAIPGTNGILRTTMPIHLFNEPVDNEPVWKLEEEKWAVRQAGNDASVPFPKFINKTINSMTEIAGRLILTHDSGIALSETAEPLNLFKVTATDLLVTDAFPLDGGSLKGNLNTPVSLNGQLFVWGDQDQLVLSGTPISISSSALTGVSTYTADTTVEPVVTGDIIHYISQNNNYNTLHAYSPKPGTQASMGSESVSDQISTLLPGKAKQLISNPAMNSVLVALEDEPTKIFLYSYYIVDNKLKQSAWSVLEFNFNIEHIYVFNNTFRMITNVNSEYHIVEMDIRDLDRPDKTYLDLQQDLTFVNGIAPVEVIVNGMIVVDTQDNKGALIDFVDNLDGTITADSLLTEPTYTAVIGSTYEMKYTPRQIIDMSTSGRVTFNVTHYLQTMGLLIGNSGQFTVTIKGDGFEDTFNYNLGELPGDIFEFPGNTYEERVAIAARSSDELDITISSTNQFPLLIRGLYFDFSTGRRRISI